MKRIFAAIKIAPSDEFLDVFRKIKSALKNEKIKWVEEHNMHLTLKFFGETDEEQIPMISKAIQLSVATSQRFKMEVAHTGVFGSTYKPRVIWFGIHAGEQLQHLYMTMTERLLLVGIEPDRQNFVPHLTIGRVKYIGDKNYFQKVINRYSHMHVQETQVHEVLLMESVLTSRGPEYSVLERYPLHDKK